MRTLSKGDNIQSLLDELYMNSVVVMSSKIMQSKHDRTCT
jgi:hypothetical protein